jgi:alpha-beta hydrolase superfamily lysophospholipase
MSWEKMISSRSIGYACEITLVVVSWVVKDWPRLPPKTWPIQMKYCSASGLSRPSWWLRIAAFCGVSLGPRMATEGFPGSRWTRKKAATETKKTMRTRRTARLAMYVPTPAPPFSCPLSACVLCGGRA